ncbi:terpene synthase family protein [Streptomyces sp. NPDC059552]|uniref:terpene synthase family protein n=1 Tax=Streptomyces sp. NPDC059552 TaxID=3346862 RepID=UPI0036CC93EB
MSDYPAHVMPFPPVALNPALEQVRVPVWEWIEQSGIACGPSARRLLRRADPELTCARYFPAASPALLIYLSELTAWAFVNDDQFDDGRLRHDPAAAHRAVEAQCAALDATAQPDVPDTPGVMERVLAGLWARMPADRSRAWHHVLRTDMEALLWTYATEVTARHENRIPSLKEYLAHRREAAGTGWCADLVEVVVDVDLPDKVRQSHAYQAMKDAAAEHCGLLNDMHSMGKERGTGQIHNAVTLVQHHQDCSLEEALHQVNDLATACVHRMEQAMQELSAHPAAGLWARGVRDLVRGNYDWHFESERYRHDQGSSPRAQGDGIR